MKIVFAPDKFKSCMDAPTVCRILTDAVRAELPDAETVSLPMADGGDGTVNAILAATGGERCHAVVTGPLGAPVNAEYGLYRAGQAAVLEMAAASGIALIDRHDLNPLKATTYGTGELIRAALDRGVSEILLGIGGSATVDGGAGMAQALGFRLLDATGHELPPGVGGGDLQAIATIDASQADSRLQQVSFRVACDVTSPLLGPNGSAAVFAPQKGATPATIPLLEAGLANLGDVWQKQGMIDRVDAPGDGAAGGLGAGLRAFCGAKPASGARLVMRALDFERHLAGADLVVTGEGCTDGQTDAGKLCSEIAKAAHRHGVPVLLLSGALRGNPEDFFATFDYVFSISSGHVSLDSALAGGPEDLRFFMTNIIRLIRAAGGRK